MAGNKILAEAARAAGARLMFGYPITPTTEVLEQWANFSQEDKALQFLQTEDEAAAGFGVCGAVLAGKKAFTATSGPGNILMQDPICMAEAMRLPFVGLVGQRGAPSTATVIYSQQEVQMTIFGGNSEGLRIVYSTASLQDLYDYTIKAFNNAWKYRFPTFILYDGYQGKMMGEVEIYKPKNLEESKEILKGQNLRNTYSLEEELGEVVLNHKEEFDRISAEITECETYKTEDAQFIIFAHGIVASAAREAVDLLRQKGVRAGLFRPITLWPFPSKEAQKAAKTARSVFIFESALGQFARILKSEIYGVFTPTTEFYKPGLGFTPQEIVEALT